MNTKANEEPTPDATTVQSADQLTTDAAGAAKLIGCSRSHWLRMDRDGRTPASFAFGHRRLWRLSDIKRWVAEGFPTRQDDCEVAEQARA